MKLTFLGTRGNIDVKSRRHRRHSSLMVSYYGRNVMIDAGNDWRGRIEKQEPRAVVITHAHPDHAWGLKDGSACPVWATKVAWEEMGGYPIRDRHTLGNREPATVQGILFEAFPVDHSTVAPAVGFRISAGRVAVFYVPDVVYIHDRADALRGIHLYIGDGAAVTRSLVRKRDHELIGHAAIRTQLTWCGKEGVSRAVFTHCGSPIVAGDERTMGAKVRALGDGRGVQAEIAYDGLELILR